ncbi:MAG TPA: HNH endonuclease [Longimicrobium sp.]
MTTPSHRLRETIVQVVNAAHPRSVALDEFYQAVERSVEFDAEDLAPPTRQGVAVNEPSWKRNVRNVLQYSKNEGSLVNIQHSSWRLPAPDPAFHLDASAAWPAVRLAAEKARTHGTEFRSTQMDQRYRISSVGSARIEIQRLDSPKPATLTAGEVTRAAEYLNAAGGRLGRRTVNYTVAKEVSIVFLHPNLVWSADNEWVEVVGVRKQEPVVAVYEDFGEAPDDDPAKLARFARHVRAGQLKFRRNLIQLYGSRCAVSGWGPECVLEAAHILLHAKSGLNHRDNGILLRSDLHNLFDDGLLKIDPDSFTVVLDPSLAGTPYWTLNGAALRPRRDGSHPSREYLRSRWTEADS